MTIVAMILGLVSMTALCAYMDRIDNKKSNKGRK